MHSSKPSAHIHRFARGAVLTLALATLGACADDATPTVDEHDVTASACRGLTLASVDAPARKFMRDSGLVHDGEELNADGIVSTWSAVALRPASNRCHVVMNVIVEAFGTRTLSDYPYEVVVAKKNGGSIAFAKFEDLVPIPQTLRVAIGAPDFSPDLRSPERPESPVVERFFYGELEGKSVVDALKASEARLAVGGFSSKISAKNVRTVNHALRGDPDGKASFDPTPGRTWKVAEPRFSLRRGMSAEGLDLPAKFLDEDFAAYYSASGGEVAPWGGSFLRKVERGGAWADVPKTVSVELRP